MPKEVRGGGSHCEWKSWLPRGAWWDCLGARAEAWTSQPEHSGNSPAVAHSSPLLRATLSWAAGYQTDDGLGLLGV